MEAYANLIKNKFRNLSPSALWSFKEAGRAETSAFTHDYHRYPAKFIPQIVNKLLTEFAPKGNKVICDVFGGCGTTLVEAKIFGRKSFAFDINPVAKLIAQAKVTPINPKKLEKYKKEFFKNLEEQNDVSVEHTARLYYWFDKATLRKLDKIYFVILKIKDADVRRFFLCAFSHNLKNCSRWLMKSIKPQIDPKKTIPNPNNLFLRHLDSMIKKNNKFYLLLKESGNLKVPAIMYRRDSTKTLPVKSNSVDLVITSPPYVTSYEYADLHQLSLLWFGDDFKNFKKWRRFSQEFSDFRKKFIGTSYKENVRCNYNSDIAEEIVCKLEKVGKRLSSDVSNYFSDMNKVFTEMHRILKRGGKACIIIGNTSLKGVEILNAEVAAEQMIRIGFKKINFIKRRITNKMITPWRDKKNGKFTSIDNPGKKRVYGYEYVIIMERA